jgi:putative ABC transport system permease protein
VTATQVAPAPGRLAESGGLPARRAVTRWAWRLFRREWRQQLLVLALLMVALAVTTVGMGLAATSSASSLAARFGTANRLITLSASDATLAADIAAAKQTFGTVEVIEHQKVAVPGSANPVDLRAQDPNGVYSHPMLRLDVGRYPTGPDEVAVTAGVATIFNLHIGDTWQVGARPRAVVGLVENPLDLLEKFALVAPGQANPADHVTILIQASTQKFDAAPPINGADIEIRPTGENSAAALQVLILATIGLLFIGLVAVAGFTVMAGRRLRALGMLGAIGATDRHVRFVLLANGAVVGGIAAVTGTAVGLAGWLAFAPRLESILEHRIDRFDLPWWAIGVAILLAVVTAVAAAWWPGRSAARIPVVAALSARPSTPRPAHRFAALGGLLLAAGVGLLALSHQKRALLIVTGIVSTTLGMLFFAPVGIAGIASAGRRSPIATRIALRDLARYRARSGAALAAVSLAVGIAAAVVIYSAASQAAGVGLVSGGNLPTNQLIVWLAPEGGLGGPVPELTSAQLQNVQIRVNTIASSLHGQFTLALTGALDPTAPVEGGAGNGIGGRSIVELGKGHQTVVGGKNVTEFRDDESIPLFVATPEVLAHYGIKPSDVDPTADILTSRTGLSIVPPRTSLAGYQLIGAFGGQEGAQLEVQTVKLPTYTSDPTTLITTHALQTLGLTSVPVGWLIQTPQPLTAAQIDQARQLAVAAGVSIESRPTKASLSRLRTDATAAGVLVALGVLAMTVGLIRSETARDLRTLAATGASSTTRRSITGATAGALALLGALLGTAGAYLALVAWYRRDLHVLSDVPVIDLMVIVVGLPLGAAAAGWLLAGREPPAIARQPLE